MTMIVPESPRTPKSGNRKPYVQIIKQPDTIVRFRYSSEGRKTSIYPAIKICGYTGKVISIVSCVTAEEPHKPHPHQLLGTHCSGGACIVQATITERNSQILFKELGLQSVKKEEINESLRKRQEKNVDPYKTGFEHSNDHLSINLNCVKLCFQVFLQDESTGRITDSLEPILSEVIYDEKTISDLTIVQVSHRFDSYQGGTLVILLGKRLLRNDIAVVFSQKDGRRVVWEKRAKIERVHKQTAVTFRTPRYEGPTTTGDVQVYLQLMRTTDFIRSSPEPFKYKDDHSSTRFSDSPEDTKDHKNAYQWTTRDIDIAGPSYGNCGYDMYTPQGSPNLINMCAQNKQPNLLPATSNVQWNSPNDQSLMLNMAIPQIYQRTNGRTPQTPLSMQGIPISVEQVSPSIAQMSMSMEQVSPSIAQMSMSMEQVSPSIAQMSMSMEQVSPSIAEMSMSTEQVSPSIREMPLIVEQASPTIRGMPMSMEQAAPNIRGMPMRMEQASPTSQGMTMAQISPSMNQMIGITEQVLPTIEHMIPILMQKQVSKDQNETSCLENQPGTNLLVNSDDPLPQLNSGLTSILGSCEDLSDSLSRIFL